MMKRPLAVAGALVIAALATATAYGQEHGGTLRKIRDTGTITLGFRESSIPFSYLDEKQQPVGYSMDLCYKVVEALKTELKMPNLQVKLNPVVSQTRIPLVANGTVDLECGSTTNTLTRQQQVTFSPVTFIAGTRLLVKKGSGIREVEDLKGKSVSVSQGTTNERVIKKLNDDRHLGIRFLMVKDHSDGFLALETGRADANVSDDIQLYGLVSKAKRPQDYEVVGRLLSYEPFGLVMRRDDAAFQLVVTRTLAELMRSGEINKIYDKWFRSKELNVPLSPLLKSAFEVQALPE
jgi:glutamate/aspartate transport system substrate-binding protein